MFSLPDLYYSFHQFSNFLAHFRRHSRSVTPFCFSFWPVLEAKLIRGGGRWAARAFIAYETSWHFSASIHKRLYANSITTSNNIRRVIMYEKEQSRSTLLAIRPRYCPLLLLILTLAQTRGWHTAKGHSAFISWGKRWRFGNSRKYMPW